MISLDEAEQGARAFWIWRSASAVAVVTTRAWGNLAAHVGDDPEEVRNCRNVVARELLPAAQVATVRQVHGIEALTVPGNVHDWCELSDVGTADALIESQVQRPVAVFTADCVPIVISSDTQVAVVHAGWRGMVDGVIEKTVASMTAFTHAKALVGPCIGPCCFEVGSEVAERFPNHCTMSDASGVATAHVDLPHVASDRLNAVGCSVEHINVCTRCDPRMHSFRRDGQESGRQAVIAWRT